MVLRYKVALVMAVAILLMIGLNAAVLVPVSRSFTDLEQAEARRNSARVEKAISAELNHMARNALDWSNWDDAYEFAAGRRPSFIEDNLYFETLQNLDVNLIYVYDRAGNIAWGEAYDLDTEAQIAIPQFAPGALRADSPLLAPTGRETSVTGIIATDSGPMLIASSPIVPSEGSAPASGTFVLGRLLDATLTDRIREQAGVDFEIEPATVAEGTVDREPLVIEASPDLITAEVVLNGVDGRPVLRVRSMTPRDISRIGDQSIGISLLSLAVIGIVDLLVMWILLRQLVLLPVARITESILEIGRTGALDRRIPALAGDELGVLAREFNRMLDRLTDANKRLIDQSHRTGMAEMAAGVLHNLRNGLSPLMGRLDIISETLRSAPGGELRRAVDEFKDPQTDPVRKSRLLDYVAATGDSQLQLKETTLAELDRARALTAKLGEILRYQEKFIYSSSKLEPISVSDALRDAMDMLPPHLTKSVSIDIDWTIGGLPPAMAERIGLMQVLHNLILNAIEAIGAAECADGRISVTAVQSTDVPGMIDVQVRDNGIGIESGTLARIFERGYTTKPSGAGGLGLHWCANTAISMHGKLHAESGGSGRGATFHLLLPAANQAMAAE